MTSQPISSAKRSGPRLNRAIAFATVLLGFLAYANTFSGAFVWDDASSILLHQHVRDPGKFPQLFAEDQHAFGRGQGNFYRPLLSASFMLDYALSTIGAAEPPEGGPPQELSPFLFHLSSVAWHIAAALALLGLAIRLKAPATTRALLPLLYAVHPLHTEAVAYISGRADSMSAAFIFAGLLCATVTGDPRKRMLGAALSLLCFVGALLSKESSMIYPLLLVLAVLMQGANEQTKPLQTLRARTLALAGAAVLLIVYLSLRATALNFAEQGSTETATVAKRLSDTVQSFAIYMRLLLAPSDLHMERTLDAATTATTVAGTLCLAMSIGLLLFALSKQKRHLAFGLGWFLIAWAPISGIFPLNAPLAEHWMYVPMAGFFWALLDIVIPGPANPIPAWRGSSLRAPTLALLAVWLLFLFGATTQRNLDWRTNESIYTATLRANPHSRRVHYNLAVAYQVLTNNPSGARRHFNAVIREFDRDKSKDPSLQGQYWPEELEAYRSLGDLWLEEQRFREAANHYAVVLAIDPAGPNRPLVGAAAYGMGHSLLALGRTDQAIQYFQTAREIRPEIGPEIDKILAGIEAAP